MTANDVQTSTAPAGERWRSEGGDVIDAHAAEIVSELSESVRHSSISGTDGENSMQSVVAAALTELNLEIDHWEIPLGEILHAADFPGVEVDRSEAWGLVGVAHGRGDGPSLML